MRSSTVARSGYARRSSKLFCAFLAVALCCGLFPIDALAEQTNRSLIPEGEPGAVRVVSGAEGRAEEVSHSSSDSDPSVDADSAASYLGDDEDIDDATEHTDAGDAAPSPDEDAVPGSDVEGGDASNLAIPAGDVVNQEVPLSTVAQAESIRTFFLAQTLEATRTVPVVSAKLPLDPSMRPQAGTLGGEMAAEGAEVADGDPSVRAEGSEEPEEGEGADDPDLGIVAADSIVVGAFEHLGMTFAIEPGGESVALMAVDYAKLPEEFVSKQVIVIPEMVSPDGIDVYSVTRIASGAFSSLKKESADPDHTGARELFSDEDLLAEAGIDPAEVAGFLADEGVTPAARDGEDADAPSDMQTQAEACADEGNEESECALSEVRTIVSIDGNVATLDDGSAYEFANPLVGCTGILALGIPASVSSIDDDAFAGSDTLQYLVVSGGNPTYAFFDGALYSADFAALQFVPEGRSGLVRIASGATEIAPTASSRHLSSDALIVDVDSEAYQLISEVDQTSLSGKASRLFGKIGEVLEGKWTCMGSGHDGGAKGFSDALDSSDRITAYSSTEAPSPIYSLSRNLVIDSYTYVKFNNASVSCAETGCVVQGGPGTSTSTETGVSFTVTAGTKFWDCKNITGTISFGTVGHHILSMTIAGVEYKSAASLAEALNRTYSVTWNGNGATSGVPSNQTGVTSVTISTPKCSGYSFNGWSASGTVSGGTKNSFGYYTSGTVTLGSNVTFTAQWLPSYTLAFNANGGSGTPPASKAMVYHSTAGTSYAIPSCTLTKTGYTFDGWATSATGAKVYEKTATVKNLTSTAGATYTLYAHWTANKYTVSFSANGGSGGQSANVTATYASAMPTISTTKPTRAGFTFMGWYDNATYTSGTQYYTAACASARSWNKTANTTLYAGWKANTITLTWNSNGGTAVSNTTQTYSTTAKVALPTAPTRAGFTFKGWFTSTTSTTQITSSTALPTSNTTYYAQWTANTITLTWNSNGGSAVANTTQTYSTTAKVTLPTAPTRAGFTFKGWFTSTTSTTQITSSTALPSSNTTYYAQWTANTITLTWNSNGGSAVANTTQTYSTTAKVTLPTAPTRAGFTFKGWFTAATGGTQVTSSTALPSSNTTYHAQWTGNPITLSWDSAGGSSVADTTQTYSTTAKVTLPAAPTRAGYTFKGWFTSASGGAQVTASTVLPASNTTYHAQWDLNTYHLSWSIAHGTHANRTSDFTVEDCPIAMTAATPDAGYAFSGWSGTGIEAGSVSFEVTSAMLAGKGDGETFSYAASIAPRTYELRLHANDGTGTVVASSATFDAPVDPAEVPRRYGYAFAGYWTKEADGSKGEPYFDEAGAYVRDGGVWKGLSDIELYACWILIGSFEVPISAPGAVTLGVDRATVIGEDASGVLAGESAHAALRSTVPQEVSIASVELEALEDADGTVSASRILGEGNPEACAVEVSFDPSSQAALLRLAGEPASRKWTPPQALAPKIPAATSVPAGTQGDDVVSDASGNLARAGELPLTYAIRLLPGFDVYEMPSENVTSEPVARIVFTVDLTGLVQEEF